jgi:RNA polymerase sigma factor (sigma-70 family)
VSAFPETQHTLLQRLNSGDAAQKEESLDVLVRLYYRPVYGHLRARWRLAQIEAEDVAQEFFSDVIERGIFAAYRPERGRFRTFVRACIDHHMTSELRFNARQKRGGNHAMISIDASDLEARLAAGGMSADDVFEAEWRRSLVTHALAELRRRLTAQDKLAQLTVFERYDLAEPAERPTYAKIAADLGLAQHDVTNYLYWVRRELRGVVQKVLAELSATPEELREELEALGAMVSTAKT